MSRLAEPRCPTTLRWKFFDEFKPPLQVLTAGLTGQLDVLQQDVRMVRAVTHDMGETRVIEGEVEVLHEDVSRVQQGLAEPTAEGRGISRPEGSSL
jgi:hypothetical protein